MTYYIVGHDGTLNGDCMEFPEIKVKSIEGLNFRKIAKLILTEKFFEEFLGKQEHYSDDLEYYNEERERLTKSLKGAWILNKSDYNKLVKVMCNTPPAGGDSMCYAYQAVFKSMYHSFAIKSYGKKPTTGRNY